MDLKQQHSLWKDSNKRRSPEDFILKKKGKFQCTPKSLNCLCDVSFLHAEIPLVTVALPLTESVCEQLKSPIGYALITNVFIDLKTVITGGFHF